MNLSRKVFLGIFASTLLVGSALLWASHHLVSARATESYLQRYDVLSRTLGRTLTQLERNTESLMFAAAQVVAGEESQRGVMSDAQLKKLATQLQVTHIFEINQSGKFIRSTNENPSLIPNLFSFCGGYRDFANGVGEVQSTPIIPPMPEPNPYKFLLIRNKTGERMIEVGVRVDFLGKTLTDAIRDDANVLAINLYAPDGTTLGSFSRAPTQYQRAKKQLPIQVDSISQEPDQFRLFSRVDSGHTQCCQCDKAGISKDGQYYYVFEFVVSKKALQQTLVSVRQVFLALELLAILVGLIAARWISARLVARVQLVSDRVRQLGSASGLSERIGVKGADEVAFLAGEFDGLLGRLEKSQKDLLATQKTAALGEVAGQVAHNIAAPVRALEMMLTNLSMLPTDQRRIIRSAIAEVRDLVESLKSKRLPAKGTSQEALDVSSNVSQRKAEIEMLSELVEAAVSETRIQFRDRPELDIAMHLDGAGYGLFSCVNLTEFKVLISNLIRNGIEAIEGVVGTVRVSLRREGELAIILVSDNGKGIGADIISKIGDRGATFGKKNGTGIGLHHAITSVRQWGGNLKISSKEGEGTQIRIELPLAKPPSWFLPEIVLSSNSVPVLVDDDPINHFIWRSRLKECNLAVELKTFTDPQLFIEWVSSLKSKSGLRVLMDFEFVNSKLDGLKVIDMLGISEQSILSTGNFGDAEMMARAEWLSVPVLPKSLVPWVPIRSQ